MDTSTLLVNRRGGKSGLARLFCCCYTEEQEPVSGTSLASPQEDALITESTQSAPPSWKIMEYASGRIYIIGSSPRRLFARFRHVDLGSESMKSSMFENPKKPLMKPEGLTEKQWDVRYDLFSRFDEGVQVPVHAWESAVPERIAKHISRRCKSGVVLDAYCGIGSCSIQFARFSKVIALSESVEKISQAEQNAFVYGVQARIQFKHGEFLKLSPHLLADIVFLDFNQGFPDDENGCLFDIFAVPNLKEILQTAERYRSVVMYLPKSVDPVQVAGALVTYTTMNLALDFDLYHLGGYLKGVSCYAGALATLSREEMHRVLCSRLRLTEETQTRRLLEYFEVAPLSVIFRVLTETENESGSWAGKEGRPQLGPSFIEKLSCTPDCQLYESPTNLASRSPVPDPFPLITLHTADVPQSQEEVIHMIMAYCDCRYSHHRVKGAKSDHQFEITGFPVLETEGKKMHSIRAIARYLCQVQGLYSEEKVDVYHTESLVAYLSDVSRLMTAAEATGQIEDFCKEALPEIFDILSCRVRDKCGVGGTRPRIGDFFLLELLWRCSSVYSAALPDTLRQFQVNMCVGPLAKYLDEDS